MSARKFTAAERAVLESLLVRCVVAAVDMANAAPARATAAGFDVFAKAEADAIAAGKAFDRALRKIRGGK